MGGEVWRDVAAEARFARDQVAHAGRTVALAWRGMDLRSEPARAAGAATVAVVLAVLIACAMHLDEVWWAAISAYVVARPQAVRRIVGTIAGAALGIVSVGWLAYDPLGCCLMLFAVTVIGTIGFNVSRHGYGWLLMSVTFAMIVVSALPDPRSAFTLGVGRVIEVVIGTAAAVAVAIVRARQSAAGAAPRGWADLLGTGLPITMHAIRSGVTVAAAPVLWSAFDLPAATQMAVTVAVVLATPVLADAGETHRHVVGRALQRIMGCVVGGVGALAVLGLSFDAFLPWLAVLAAGVWVFAYIQYGEHDVRYVGTQAGVVFILTLVQSDGPPQSILPALDRFAGMSVALVILFLATFLIGHGVGAAGVSRAQARS
jgi:uncharacterized membrane protein YccC